MSDVYTPYEAGLRALLARLGHDHPLYDEALVYQQRLTETIAAARRYGDTEARRAARAEIVDRLNGLAREALGISYNSLCRTGAEADVTPKAAPPPGEAAPTSRPAVPAEGEPSALIAAALEARRLLLVWAEVYFPPQERPTDPAALLINHWRREAQALPPFPWPVPRLPPLTILSLDPGDRIEGAFREADVPLNVLCTRRDVIDPQRHNLIKLGGDLASRDGLLLTWAEVRDAPNDPDKVHLLEEARRVARDGVVLTLGRDPGGHFLQLWHELVSAYTGGAKHHVALGPADARWPEDARHLSADVNGVLARLTDDAVPPPEPAEAASLRRRLTEARENLRLIEERASEYVMSTDVPLQLVKQERRLREQIAELERQLGLGLG